MAEKLLNASTASSPVKGGFKKSEPTTLTTPNQTEGKNFKTKEETGSILK